VEKTPIFVLFSFSSENINALVGIFSWCIQSHSHPLIFRMPSLLFLDGLEQSKDLAIVTLWVRGRVRTHIECPWQLCSCLFLYLIFRFRSPFSTSRSLPPSLGMWGVTVFFWKVHTIQMKNSHNSLEHCISKS
jgi:hypothetical protein